MRVADNGRGITKAQADASGSLGLLGMRERVRLAGGTLTVAPLSRGGTEVVVRVPLAGENGSCES
jgi:two-component system, NarL family, sensor histidine kinase UhpB